MKTLPTIGFIAILAMPFLAEVVSSSWVRLWRFHGADWLLYALLAAISVTFWCACATLVAASRRRAIVAVPVALLLGVVVGAHAVFFAQYSSVITAGYIEEGYRHGFDARRTIAEQRWMILAWVGLPALLSYGLLLVARPMTWLRTIRNRWKAAWLGAGLCALPFLPDNPAKPVDIQMEHSVMRFAWHRVTGRDDPRKMADAPYVPPARGNRIHVLFILSESLRFDSYCNDPSAPCEVTPETNRVMHDRVPLYQMRSNDSFTIMSTAVLTTGLPILASRQELEAAPNLFELARAAGRHTEYLGSHKIKYLFLRTANIDQVVTFSDLSNDDDYEYADEDLARLATRRIAQLGSDPWFVMLQFGDTHSPYSVDPGLAPFRPYERDFSWDGTPKLFNQYRNAVYRQDAIIGGMLDRLRSSGALDDAIVLFTSDHGEAFREHTQLYHGGSVHEEEVHVPAWIWAASSVRAQLGPAWARLADASSAPWTHLDVVPTVLDAMGVLDEPAWRGITTKLWGTSMLRGRTRPRAIPIGNCNDLLACAFKNWGVMQGLVKIEAREWDGYWNCWDLSTGKNEPPLLSMSDPACQELLVEARKLYPTLPNGRPF